MTLSNRTTYLRWGKRPSTNNDVADVSGATVSALTVGSDSQRAKGRGGFEVTCPVAISVAI